jgi:hypothetical protein
VTWTRKNTGFDMGVEPVSTGSPREQWLTQSLSTELGVLLRIRGNVLFLILSLPFFRHSRMVDEETVDAAVVVFILVGSREYSCIT